MVEMSLLRSPLTFARAVVAALCLLPCVGTASLAESTLALPCGVPAKPGYAEPGDEHPEEVEHVGGEVAAGQLGRRDHVDPEDPGRGADDGVRPAEAPQDLSDAQRAERPYEGLRGLTHGRGSYPAPCHRSRHP